MEDYKTKFIDFLLKEGALKIGGEFKLKSGRVAPHFFNAGALSTGYTLRELGRAYQSAISAADIGFDVIFGPAYKGIPLSVATAIAFAEQGREVRYSFDRKEAKNRGEATGNSQREWIVGSELQEGDRVLLIDDVLTTGAAKYEAISLLDHLAKVQYTGLVIALDREEVDDTGKSALEQFVQKTGIPTTAILKVTEVYEHCRLIPDLMEKAVAMHSYLLQNGTKSAKERLHFLRSQKS